tara:strand:- start:44 stop:1195 length:1152 start_codon:yes stop_codon:yes gene_type:complete
MSNDIFTIHPKLKQSVNYNTLYPINKILQNKHIGVLGKDQKIFVCLYKIIRERNQEKIIQPYIQYLLYKYSKDVKAHYKSVDNMVVFPFVNGDEKTHANVLADNLANFILNKTENKITADGCLLWENNYYFFYNTLDKHEINLLYKNNKTWWCLIDEICNHNKIINYPIHHSAYELFYNFTDLIYLKKGKNNIEIPIVAYKGGPKDILKYLSTFGNKTDDGRYGTYYYFSSLRGETYYAGWSGKYTPITFLNKTISDNKGQYLEGGYTRFALFMGDYTKYIMYNENESFFWYINYLDYNKDKPAKEKKDAEIKDNENIGKWANKYASLSKGIIPYRNIHGYFSSNPLYVIKDFSQQIPLSYHILNRKSLKTSWDPLYNQYCIK